MNEAIADRNLALEADLSEDAHEEFIHLVVQPRRHLDVFTLVLRGQALSG